MHDGACDYTSYLEHSNQEHIVPAPRQRPERENQVQSEARQL